jgi:hypothetical protein
MFAAAGLFVSGVALPSAQAADLGGDCCADLEERVAELEATVARKGNRRVSLTISGQVQTSIMAWDAGGAFGATNAKEGSIQFGDITEEIAPGQVGVIDANDTANVKKFSAPVAARKAGNSSDVYILDHTPGTFVSFAGAANINPNVSAGFQVVLAINRGARSHHVSQIDDDASDIMNGAVSDSTFVMTLGNWYVDHKQLGRLTVGRANMATAGITTIDLGGAGASANANIGWWNAGFFYANGASGANTWGDLLGGATVNGASTARSNVVHYTSPTFGGLSLQASWGENDVWDVAARFAGEFSGFRIAAGLGYASNVSGVNEVIADISQNAGIDVPSQVKGSASVLHVASGLFLTGAYVRQYNDHLPGNQPDTTLLYLQGGISKNWTGLGNTTVYGEWAEVQDALKATLTVGADGQAAFGAVSALGDANMWGIGINQAIDAAAMDVYLGYRSYSADAASEDFTAVMGGARLKF